MAGRLNSEVIKIATASLRHELRRLIYKYYKFITHTCKQILFTPFVAIKGMQRQKIDFPEIYFHMICKLSEDIIHECNQLWLVLII